VLVLSELKGLIEQSSLQHLADMVFAIPAPPWREEGKNRLFKVVPKKKGIKY
jgi:hypothetical protein